jgi:hypothetical protein
LRISTYIKERVTPAAKLWYLIAVVLALLLLPSPTTTLILLLVQACLWAAFSLGWRPLAKLAKRLAVFFLIITISYAFFSVGDHQADRWTDVAVGPWTLAINLAGLSLAVMMCLRVLVLVAASVWVQESGKPGDFVRALEQSRVPRFLAASIDGTIQLVSGAGGGGEGRGGGGGGGRGQGRGAMEKQGRVSIGFEQLRHGNLSFMTEMVERGLDRAEQLVVRANPEMDREQAKDIAIIVGMATAIMGTKLLQVLPGFPVAPGHKNVVIIPFLLLAARLTHKRFGGLWTGLTAGVVSVLSGYGQYGVLEIAHFAVPGIMADILVPLVRPSHPRWLRFIEFGLIGGLLGIGRFTANFLVILLAGAPGMAVVLYLPMLASQVMFGTLSAFVSMAVLDLVSRSAALPVSEPPKPAVDVDEEGRGKVHAGGGGGTGRHRRASP